MTNSNFFASACESFNNAFNSLSSAYSDLNNSNIQNQAQEVIKNSSEASISLVKNLADNTNKNAELLLQIANNNAAKALEGAKQVSSAKSPQEVANIQLKLIEESSQDLIANSSKLQEQNIKAFNDISKSLNDQIQKSLNSFTKNFNSVASSFNNVASNVSAAASNSNKKKAA